MNNLKKIIACFTAFIMMFFTVTTTSAAEVTLPTDEKLTGHEFTAYQIFSGEYVKNDDLDQLQKIAWGSGIDPDKFIAALKADTNLKVVTKENPKEEKNAAQFLPSSDVKAQDVADFISKADTTAAEKIAKIALANKKGEGTKLTAGSNELSDGYYLIVDTTEDKDNNENEVYNAALLEVFGDGNITVDVKADKPDVDKKIITGLGESDRATSNETSIGSSVAFELTSTVPDMTYYDHYVFVMEDNLSKGLSVSEQNIKDMIVKVGTTTLTQGTLEEKDNANKGKVLDANGIVVTTPAFAVKRTGNADGGTKLEIVFANFIQYKTNKNAAIVVQYSAQLNENAVVGVKGNPNTVKLIYSNDPDESGKGTTDYPGPGDVTGKTPDKTVITYTTKLEITKHDQDGRILTGAGFTVTGNSTYFEVSQADVYTEDESGTWYQLKDGKYTQIEPAEETKDKYVSTETKYTLTKGDPELKTVTVPISKTDSVNAQGVVEFKGLGAGTYNIEETTVPTGYNKMADKSFNVSWVGPTGNITKDSQCQWSTSTSDFNIDNGGVKTTIVNKKGNTLPETGGMGTTMLYIAGGVLVLGSVVFFMTNRKMKKD